MLQPRQMTIMRLMVAVALFAGLFALPGPLAIVVACLGITLGFLMASAALVARLGLPGPGRPHARVNVPALAFGALGLGGIAILVLIGGFSLGDAIEKAGRGSAFGLRSAGVALGIVIGTFGFVVALSAVMGAEAHCSFGWKLLAFLAMLITAPAFFGLPIGLMLVSARVLFRP